MPEFVQSASIAVSGSSASKAFTDPNGAGNCLVAFVGIFNNGLFADPVLTDTQGNTWIKLLNAPELFPSGVSVSCEYAFVAYNCKAGANTVTATTNATVALSFSILEYSGAATASARDQITAAANAFSSSVSTGTITTQYPNEVIISCGYDQSGDHPLTPSGGWTFRETVGTARTLTTWDQIVSSRGSFSNTITVASSSTGLHAIILSLADTPTTDLLAQPAVGNTSQSGPVSVAFSKPNQAGSLLLLGIGIRSTGTLGAISSVSDTRGNTWTLLGSSPLVSASGQSKAFLYQCASCSAGDNTVTVATSSVEIISILALEYLPRQMGTVVGVSTSTAQSISSGSLPTTGGVLAFSVSFNQSNGGGIYSDFSGSGWKQRGNVTSTDASFGNFGSELSVFDQIVPATGIIEQTVSVGPATSGLHLIINLSVSTFSSVVLTGGNFQDASGRPLANGFVLATLSQDSLVSSANTQLYAGRRVLIPLDNNGNLAGSPALFATDQMLPTTSTYVVAAYSSTGILSWGPNRFTLPSTSSVFDVTQWVP